MTATSHDPNSSEDRHARSVECLLVPSLNLTGYSAYNLRQDSLIMLAGSLATTDANFIQDCLTSCIEADSFAPDSRVVVMTSADFTRWKSIRAAFIAASRTSTPFATIIPR